MRTERSQKIFSNTKKNRGIGYNISRFLEGMKSNMDNKKEVSHEEEMENLKQAHKEWKQSELYFENVTNDELIDHAIYNMEATKKKYFYLLNQLREKISEENA